MAGAETVKLDPLPMQFGDLSVTGAVINAYNAMKMAAQLAGRAVQ